MPAILLRFVRTTHHAAYQSVRRASLPALLLAAGLSLAAGDSTSGAAPPAPAPAAPALTVLAAGDLRGEIEPCGCSADGQFGGLRRRLTYLERQFSADPAPILVDLGNNYPEPTAQGRHKIALIRDLLLRFAPQAVLPGPGELALGPGVLSDGLPYVLSNAAAGAPAAATPVRRVTRAGTRVGVYGYLSPREVYQGEHSALRLRPVDAALLAELGRRVREGGDGTSVLLFRGEDAELAAFAGAGLFDRIVAGNPSADELKQITERRLPGAAGAAGAAGSAGEASAGGVTVPQVPTKGQGVLRLPLAGAATDAGPPPVDWLDAGVADHPAAAPAFDAYDAQVKALFFARLETMERRRSESLFVGAQACAACHAAAMAVWRGSRHSHALATLERVGKQHDPECLACHVVGLEREGYLSAELTPQLANVQCENCHGPARMHLARPARAPGPPPGVAATAEGGGSAQARPGEATCRTCHVGSHSPAFDFARYWPKVAHAAPADRARP